MATNPMQRKANNYLIIGVLVTLLITGTIIGILCYNIIQIQEERNAEQDALRNVYALNTAVKSGDAIDVTQLTTVSIPQNAVPTSAISLGLITENTIAKIDLNPGTIVTTEMLAESGEETTNDLRKVEYNMIMLSSQIESGEYIDVRLRLPSGADYIVVSKKRVELPLINGVDSENTIWLNMTEDEILVMSNAIIEAYIMEGGLLYVSTYVEPGLQENATPTYVPSGTVQEAIYLNPNIEQEAKAALISRYNNTSSIRTNTISSSLAPYVDTATDNITTGVEEEITRSQQQRQQYLESLGGAY